jgi:hypothetical protein
VEKLVEPERPEMTIWCMRIGRCIPKATNMLSEYVIFVALLQQWLHAPQCCVLLSLPVFFHYWTDQMKYGGMARRS